MAGLISACLEADLFIFIGTSGLVYPAAGLAAEAQGSGIRTCEINLEPSDNARQFDEALYGLVSEVVPRWVEECLLAVRTVIWDSEASDTVALRTLSGPLDSRVEFIPSHGSNLEFPVRRNPC